MGRSPTHNPSFFKVLIGDFTNKLRIPPAFTRNFGRTTFNKAVLKTCSGESWRVKIEQEDSCYSFKDGWRKFVKDQHLEAGDFLVFWFYGDSTFQVVAYDRSGCEKRPILGGSEDTEFSFSSKLTQNGRDAGNHAMPMKMESEDEGANKVAAPTVGRKQPQFVKILRRYHDYKMAVPKDFATETGMRWCKRTLVRDPGGREWAVKVCKREKGKTELTSGWSDFVKANKLGDGDTCLFKGIDGASSHMIQVEITGRGRGRGRRRAAINPQTKLEI